MSLSSDLQSAPLLPLRRAMEAGDREAVLEHFAPDAVLRSPFTDRVAFRGREQIGAAIGVVIDVFEDLTYTDEVHAGDQAVLILRTRVGTRTLEVADHMRLDDQGRIVEFTVFFRPLPALAVAMRAIASGLVRRRSGSRGALVSALTAPLGTITEVGDRIGARLVGGTL